MAQRVMNFLVGPESDGMRLDAFLATGEDMPSRSACARLVEDGAVTINETPATSKSEKVLLGDRAERSFFHYLRDERVAVHACAFDGDEEAVFFSLPAVDHDA